MKYEYNGYLRTINGIATIEGLDRNSLNKAYNETQDIYEAVRLAKKRQKTLKDSTIRVKFNGKSMTIAAIATQEGLNKESLRRAYNETQDIDEAIKIVKSRKIGKVEKIEYNGQKMTLSSIASQEHIERNSLKKAYEITHDINEAVRMAKQRQKLRSGSIEYNGEMMTIEAIARQESVSPVSLRKRYSETHDINEAVQTTKKRQLAQNGTIEYNGQLMTISAIARQEGLHRDSLRAEYKKTNNINKAVLICQNRQIKRTRSKKVSTKFGTMSLQDLSLILGIKYSELQSLLFKGFTIDQIQSMQIKTNRRSGVRKASTQLPNGQSLREYCIENSLNYSCIYRAINTYGKSLLEATKYYKEHGQEIPRTWIYERYGVLLRHIMLNDNIDIDRVVFYMRTDLSSLDEAVEKYIIRRNAKKNDLDVEWMEEIYGVLTDINTKEEYDEWIDRFFVSDEEENCIIESFDETEQFKRKLDLFEIGDALINEVFTPDEEKELLKQYKVTPEEIDIIFLDLYGRFSSGVLRGQSQKEQQRKELLNKLVRDWTNYDNDQRRDLVQKNGITQNELRYIKTTSSLIEELKEQIREEPSNQDNQIITIMRNSVRQNVGNNKKVRAEFRRMIAQSKIR